MAGPSDLDSEDLLPRWFGDYVLLRHLGKGGMGQVFLARSPGLEGIDRPCVIKTLRPQWTNDAEYVARFVDEARVVVQLNHKNICPVFDVGMHQGTYYLAMDLVAGRDLQALLDLSLQRQEPLTLDIVLYAIAEVLEALDAAHRLRHPETDAPLNLVHRDVSPHNVLVSFEGEVKLIDFGLAKSSLKHQQTNPGVVLGKLAYMAPEHARGEPVDRRTDVFAVGVMLYELALGERYWHGLSQHDIWQVVGHGTYQPPGLERLPAGIRDVVVKATAPHPSQRFFDAAAMRQAVVAQQIARGVVAGSAELRATLEHLLPGVAAVERRERAAWLKVPVPPRQPQHVGSTRIAVASGLAPAGAAPPGHATPFDEPTLTESPEDLARRQPPPGLERLPGLASRSDHPIVDDDLKTDPSVPDGRSTMEATRRQRPASGGPASSGSSVHDAWTPAPPPAQAKVTAITARPQTAETTVMPRRASAAPSTPDDSDALLAAARGPRPGRWVAILAATALAGAVVVTVARSGPGAPSPTAPVVSQAGPPITSAPAEVPAGAEPAGAPSSPTADEQDPVSQAQAPAPTPTPVAPATPPTPTIKQTVVRPTRTSAPALGDKKRTEPSLPPSSSVAPWPAPLPAGILGRIALLRERCQHLSCASAEIAVNKRYLELSPHEASAHQERTLQCLLRCRDGR